MENKSDALIKDDVAHQMETIWREIFNVETVTAEDDFFRLGGDSLAATVLMTRIDDVFGIQLEPIEIFELPSFGEFCASITSILKNEAVGEILI